jgi:ADP-L-glycero-D-manno-heptose 6-epimerase
MGGFRRARNLPWPACETYNHAMILVTGGAGFIGSNLIASLNERGLHEIAVVDQLGREDKWRNLAKRELAAMVEPAGLEAFLARYAGRIETIFHLGAISSTTEADADRIVQTNFSLSQALWDWCVQHDARFVYASSAATYGDGAAGFDDDGGSAALARLRPLNAYGWSKHLFDRRVARLIESGAKCPRQWAGLKFFNVYGPNEYHKGGMCSVVASAFPEARASRPVRLFKSYRANYQDGGQKRDFVWVGDCVEAMLWLYDHAAVKGLFNIGSGKAGSFYELALALFRALGKEPRIEFIDMPEAVRTRYQYFTEARLDRLRQAGFRQATTTLDDGVAKYVQRFLLTEDVYR